MLKFGSLFAGIGGIDLGLERAGMECTWQVEIDEFCLRVLEKYWPNIPKYKDVCTITQLPYVDLICGGFPCQPVSVAGKRLGTEDERWLWPEFIRIIRMVRPRYVLVENVPGLFSKGMSEVLGDLASCGYDAEWDCIPAAAVGAPHLRYRVFIVAYTKSRQDRRIFKSEFQSDARTSNTMAHAKGKSSNVSNNNSRIGMERKQIPESRDSSWAQNVADSTEQRPYSKENQSVMEKTRGNELHPGKSRDYRSDWWTVEPDVGRVAYGVPNRVDRLKALGNAVVPQVAEWIGRRIMEYELSVVATE